MYQPITGERLENYRQALIEFETVKEQKLFLQQKINTLKAVDYSKEHINSGNSKKSSEQEIYTQKMEKINAKIKDYIQVLSKEKKYLLVHLGRLKRWEYEKILVLRYLENWKFKQIVYEFFYYKPDFELEEKGKYRDKVMCWHRQALQQLREITSVPYVPENTQLNFINDEI